MPGVKQCEAPDCRRRTKTAYGTQGVPMYLCSDHANRARRLIEDRDRGTMAQAFDAGMNDRSDVVVSIEAARSRLRK